MEFYEKKNNICIKEKNIHFCLSCPLRPTGGAKALVDMSAKKVSFFGTAPYSGNKINRFAAEMKIEKRFRDV